MRFTFLVITIFLVTLIFDCSSSNISPQMMGDAKMENQSSYYLPFEKIYIINLKRRLDKRLAMEKRLNDLPIKIPFEFIEAVDGFKIDRQWLIDQDAAPLIRWRDPKIRRPLTRGEIGCMMSHIYAYDKIIESNKPGLIIEDDAVFSDHFFDKLNRMKKDLTQNKWDLFYLFRQRLEDGEREIGETLISPHYSYLTLSYAVTVEGAKLLRNTPIKQNLLPSDEYLSIMFGRTPLWLYTPIFSPYQKLVAVADKDNDLMHPVETSYEDSDTEKSTLVDEIFDIPIVHDISAIQQGYYFMTVAYTNQPKHEGMLFFNRSSSFYGVSPVLIQDYDNKSEEQMFRQILQEIETQYNKMTTKINKKNLLVMILLEAHKTFFDGDPYSISIAFRNRGTFFGTKRFLNDKFGSLKDSFPAIGHNYRFLDSKVLATNYEFLSNYLNTFFNQPEPKKDFDEFSMTTFLSKNMLINLDYRCEIFQPIEINGEPLDLYIKPAMIGNHETNSYPLVVHWEPSGIVSALHIANVAGAWTLKKNAHPRDPEEIKLDINSQDLPTIFVSLNLQHHLPFDDLVVKSLLILNYPFSRLHFWIHTCPENLKHTKEILEPLISKLEKEGGSYHLESTPVANYMHSRKLSLKEAIASDKQYFFTVASIITDPNVLFLLLNSGKKAVAPLMNTIENEDITNFWLNVTTSGDYAGAPNYEQIALHEHNGMWAVPVIMNTFLLKREILAPLLNLLSSDPRISGVYDTAIKADVDISKMLLEIPTFPRLISKYSSGHYIGDYTAYETEIFHKKYNPPVWRQMYLQNNTVKDFFLINSHQPKSIVHACDAYTANFSHDFDIEMSKRFKDSSSILSTNSLEYRFLFKILEDTCFFKFDISQKVNLRQPVFSYIVPKDFDFHKDSDVNICQEFPNDATSKKDHPGRILATKLTFYQKNPDINALLLHIQLSPNYYLCSCFAYDQ